MALFAFGFLKFLTGLGQLIVIRPVLGVTKSATIYGWPLWVRLVFLMLGHGRATRSPSDVPPDFNAVRMPALPSYLSSPRPAIGS